MSAGLIISDLIFYIFLLEFTRIDGWRPVCFVLSAFFKPRKIFFWGKQAKRGWGDNDWFDIQSYFKKVVNWVRLQLKSFTIRISSGCKLSRKNVKLCASFLLNFAQISNFFFAQKFIVRKKLRKRCARLQYSIHIGSFTFGV